MIVCDNCASAGEVSEVAVTLRKRGESGREAEVARKPIHVCSECVEECIERVKTLVLTVPAASAKKP